MEVNIYFMSEKTKKDNTSSLMIKEKSEELDVIVKMLQMPKDKLEEEEVEVEEDPQEPRVPQQLNPRNKKPQFSKKPDKTYLLLISPFIHENY